MKTFIQFIKLIRIHHWSKNLLIFIPLLVSPEIINLYSWQTLMIAFFAFSFCASTTYIINDILDKGNDRNHPRKKNRPIASAFFNIYEGVFFAILMASISIYLASYLNTIFCFTLFLYFISAQIYSIKLKKMHIIDCIALSILYIMRLMCGAAAVNLSISFWLLSFSLFFFFSIALLKRYSELANRASDSKLMFGRGYNVSDLPLIANLGIPSALLSILVIGLYLNDEKIYSLYQIPNLLFLLLLTSLVWVCSVWSKALKGIEIHDPISFALKDLTSLVLFILSVGIFIIARFGMTLVQ